jgi:YD repeat-containing protein
MTADNVVKFPRQRSFYDGQGRFAGSAVRHGKWTTFYDQQGRYTGSAINTSSRR